MKSLGNLIWHIPYLGFLNALFTFLTGGLFVISVVGAPIGLGLIQLSKMYLAPFSYTMVSKSELSRHNPDATENKLWKTFGMIVWIVYLPFGLLLCAISVLQIIGMFISLIGIPAALVEVKSLGTLFKPVGKTCVPVAVREELNRRKAEGQASQYLQ
ncbi:MAG: hypothetical protein LBJ01_09540 [Tannerella sp.]|jgi:uncharacterized membrane protein YccF (DUF307 family)|nr:hypothetical protein [Tannerella sp.]